MKQTLAQPLLHIGTAAFLCLTWCISCASVQKDVMYSGTAGAIHREALETIETGLVMQRLQKDSVKLEELGIKIEALLKEPSTDSSYLAYLYALSADYQILKQQPSAARKQLATAKKHSEYDEYVQLVHSRLIAHTEERKTYLEARISQNSEYYRLKAEVGSLYFQLKDYRKALAAFDAALSFLPEAYRLLYGNQREQSLELYDLGGSLLQSSEEILQSGPFLLVNMTALTQQLTSALDFITGTAEWRPLPLAEQLQKAGWYHPDQELTATASKKDAALFLWHLIVGNDEKLLTRYTRYYTNKRKLPIPDVKMDSVYFDSIVGTVEEDIIPLVDGKNFAPDNPVSGMEFYRWLLKAEALR
ncbi:MAG: S-layer homology domain-containing protein [Treponema phagedenis]|uniref:S-layer homology domain-containing protein n=1 Tax=Treponema phagedenis TaxID=162 RepID=UPI0031341B98